MSNTAVKFETGAHLFADKRNPYQCAYRLWELRLFDGWDESAWYDGSPKNGSENLDEDDIVYVQDNYSVNRSTYYNKNIILPVNKVTEEWMKWVQETLGFVVPQWTQENNKDIMVYSKKDKDQYRAELKEARDKKIAESPNLLVAWDVIPDVLDDFSNNVELQIFFGRKQLINGSEILLSDVSGQLEIDYEAPLHNLYTIIMTDPDSPYGYAPLERERRHYIIGNIAGNNLRGGQIISVYERPFLREGQGWHRYVILLFQQQKREDFAELDKKPNNPERGGFKTREFAKQYNLGTPVGGFLFRIKAANFKTTV